MENRAVKASYVLQHNSSSNDGFAYMVRSSGAAMIGAVGLNSICMYKIQGRRMHYLGCCSGLLEARHLAGAD